MAAWLNVVLWLSCEALRFEAVPPWVRRLLLSFTFVFATWAGILAVVDTGTYGLDGLGLLLLLAVVTSYSLVSRTDVYPLATVMGSLIIISLVWLGKVTGFNNEGVFLLLAIWLIGTSTVAARILTVASRSWRKQEAA